MDGGGGDRDLADYSGRTASVVVDMDASADDGESGENDWVKTTIEDITGGSGSDDLRGDGDSNSIQGGAGGDIIFGGSGDDDLFGNDGNDALYGDDGQDELFGGLGNDSLTGGNQEDWMQGDDADDVFWAQDGSVDTVRGNDGSDILMSVDTLPSSTVDDVIL